MLAAGDLSALLQLALTALALLFGALLAVRKAASCYFVVDAAFDPGDDHRMSIGAGEEPGDGCSCAVCGRPAAKKCSRCKCVFYCSQSCQTNHWENHKLKCKQARLSDKVGNVCSKDDAWQRRKSTGFSAISLVPARGRGTGKVLQEPKKILFPYDEFVNLFKWDNPGFRPCGLLNCGNSCFANVVLQCLTCTRPLIAFLLERDHSRVCIRKDDWCFLCELQLHVQRSRENLHPFSPVNILSRLPNIGGNLGYGRQEDAHEFMRFAIDTMQSVCLDEFGGEKALDSSTQKTTLIHHIFGGHLQSQVICAKCNMISNRYENMMDLTVEIQGDAESLEECLDQFTMKEWLEGDNMYKCDGCNDYVTAWKRLTIHQAPNVLTIALKRFQSGRFGKLNKRVTFPENLDLTPYMSGNGDGTDLYTLYAVVVHLDMLNASFFGHYICYTKDYQGRWFRIDDSKVTSVEVEEVLAQGAYMLLYRRKNARREPYIKPAEAASKKHLVVDPAASNISMAIEPVDVDCVPCNAGSRSKFLQCEASNSVSLPGHERDLPIEGTNSMSDKDSGNVTEDGFQPIPLGPEDLEDTNSSPSDMPESISSLEPMQSESSIEAQICGNQEPSVANVCMEGGTTRQFDSLYSTNGVERPNPVVSGNEGIRIPSCWEKGSISKPMFARGFLDRPARKEPKEIIQRGKCGVSSLSPKVNGHVMGPGFMSPGSQSSNGNSKRDGALTEVNGQGLIGTALANGTSIIGAAGSIQQSKTVKWPTADSPLWSPVTKD